MQFAILGPIEVRCDGRLVKINGRKMRSLLAMLLLRANQVVPIERLVAVLWGERPPTTATAQVHKYVSQLRRELGRDCIVRHGGGYKIHVGDDQLDLHRFDRAVRTAVALTAERPAEAAEAIAEAIALWQGSPIADATDDLIRAETPALEERHLAAILVKVEIDLALGRYAPLVGELQALVGEHPLNEKLRGHLMIALSRSGRVAEALTAFHDGRAVLAEELGTDPGPELRALHEAILLGDAGVQVHGRHPAAERVHQPPAQLPPSIGDFTGRSAEMDLICAALTVPSGDAPVIVAISGKGGVGKTTLAVRAARRVIDAFPDGQLYLRLGGTEAQPVDPLVALQRFLRVLGVGEWAIPDRVDECSTLFRSRSTLRRLLILLDDAVDEAQVRALLPGSPTCAVLITGRPRLGGLEGARLLDLAVFEPAESVELLERIAGTRRLGSEYAAALEVAQLCGNLPLAVRIAATRSIHHPQGDLARFARRLADEQRRLDVLVVGDLQVRASLALGYQGLGPRERRAFTLLSLLDAPDFAAWVVAPLLGATVVDAEEVVEHLVNVQLLDIAGHDVNGQTRYRFHDLIRLYARERAGTEYTDDERRAALTRMLGGWLTLVAEADERVHGARFRGWTPRSFAAAHHGGLGHRDVDELLEHPLDWFEAERSALVSGVTQSCERGLTTLAWALAENMTEFLELHHHYGDWETTLRRALEVCACKGDMIGVGVMLLRLARLRFIRKDTVASTALVEWATTVVPKLGEPAIEAEAQVMHAAVLRTAGDHERALDRADEAVATARSSRNSVAQAQATHEAATIRYEMGCWEEAEAGFREAAELAGRLARRREAAQSLRYLAVVLRQSGRLGEARRVAEQALADFEGIGDRPYGAFTSLTLGLILLQLGDGSARRFIQDGLSALRELDLDYGVGEAGYVEAALELADRRPAQAAVRLVDAIEALADEPVHIVLISAVGLLADALDATGDPVAVSARRWYDEVSSLVGQRVPGELVLFARYVRQRAAAARQPATARLVCAAIGPGYQGVP